ncbi:hypothetical protein CALCODRAFT_375936 [Calocera cornea HHB12733]|uniref:Zn(2)-C6 fungal-type domain-containing protein n=1 Tax=Calocera cornea HHB12733 TaxID=1353952 RepID=A0A165EFC1_9BASI|nr:hypothetical protein CALCODRAFT_375936 [Calocera cornea HHB12733]
MKCGDAFLLIRCAPVISVGVCECLATYSGAATNRSSSKMRCEREPGQTSCNRCLAGGRECTIETSKLRVRRGRSLKTHLETSAEPTVLSDEDELLVDSGLVEEEAEAHAESRPNSLDIRRFQAACLRCKTLKFKCEREVPTGDCLRCCRLGIRCELVARKHRGLAPSPESDGVPSLFPCVEECCGLASLVGETPVNETDLGVPYEPQDIPSSGEDSSRFPDGVSPAQTYGGHDEPKIAAMARWPLSIQCLKGLAGFVIGQLCKCLFTPGGMRSLGDWAGETTNTMTKVFILFLTLVGLFRFAVQDVPTQAGPLEGWNVTVSS